MQSVVTGSIPSTSHIKDQRKWYLQLGAKHKRDSVEERPLSSLIVFFFKAVRRSTSYSYLHRVQSVGLNSPLVVVAQTHKRLANRA